VRIEADVDSDLQALLMTWPEEERPAGEKLRSLRRAMIDQASDVSGGRAHLHLAGWLGDVDADEVVNSLEAQLASELLAGRGEFPDTVSSSWHRLGEWFPPAVEARILTPLIPVYDREREQIGFYRFVLQRPHPHRRHPLPLPDRPLALLVVERMAEQLGAVEVSEVSYRKADIQAIHEAGCTEELGRSKRALEVVVTFNDGGRLVAYYPKEGTGDALCINLLN